jgi:hypothetical protein
VQPDWGTMVGLVALQASVLVMVEFLTPLSALPTWGGDPFLYQELGRSFLAGLVPYRDFPLAYPPLALPPMALPQFVLGADVSMEAYRWLFLIQNILISCGIAASLAWLALRGWAPGGPSRVLVAYALPLVALAPLVAWRYDIFVSLLVILAVVATVDRRPSLAGVALGLGALAKIYPVFLVPVLVVRHVAQGESQAAVRLVNGFLATVAVVMGPLLLVGGPTALLFIEWQQARGVEIESVVSGLVLLAHLVFGTEVATSYGFNSWQIASPLADSLAGPLVIVTLVLLALTVTAAFLRCRAEPKAVLSRQADELSAFLVVVLLVVILTNKVFSPQYLVWILPLVALRPIREASALAFIGALSIVIFPLNWPQLIALDPVMILLLNVRNLLLVAWLVWLAWRHLPVVSRLTLRAG